MGRLLTGRAIACVACSAALAVPVGCGGDDDSGDEGGAEAAARAYVDANNRRDFERVCDLYSDSYKQQLKVDDCPGYLEEQTSGARTTLTLIDVQEQGDTATAHIRSTGEEGSENITTGLVRENGSWRVTESTGYFELQSRQ